MATAKSGGFLRYFKLECSLPMSTTSGQLCSCVCSAILVALVSVGNLRLGPSAGYGGLNHHGVDGKSL